MLPSDSLISRPDSPPSDAVLSDALRRCSPDTLAAARHFHRTRDPACLPTLVTGVIARYVEPEVRSRLENAPPDLRLVEDLGVDSLTMMEIILLTEEVLQINITSEELRQLCTLGQIQHFIALKTGAPPA